MKQNTKQRAAKNTCEHDQADFDGKHDLSLGVQRADEKTISLLVSVVARESKFPTQSPVFPKTNTVICGYYYRRERSSRKLKNF
jgi:hypothetical protein